MNGEPRRSGRPELRERRIRVVLVDADTPARRQIAETLRASGRFTVVAETDDGIEGVDLARYYRPDVLLTGAEVPRLDVIELTGRAAATTPEVRVVVLTVAPEDEMTLRALHEGARGVLPRHTDAARLVRALIGVHEGESAITGGAHH